ncbi:hypothetical protein KY289_020279 [Solanum tuberosum]|nr:hypothetical protein KY289_020279 [Solanum tuberosum]
MAEGYLKFSCHTLVAIVLDRFNGYVAISSLPYGEALAWFNWLYRNKQFYDWKHFTDKLACHYRQQIVTELELPSVTDLLLQMDANFTHMRHHFDNIQNTLSACSQKFSNTQARPDLAASLVDKCDVEEVTEQEIISALNKVNLNTTEHSEVPYKMLEPHVEKSKVFLKLLNSSGSSSTSIPFPSSVISFGCVETLGPMLDSKNDLDDPRNYASKVFVKMPDKNIDMEVKHPVIYYSGNPASYMFDEMFQTSSAVKEGEYSDLIMFDNSHLALPCFLSAGSHAHLIERSIFDYYRKFDYTKLLLWLYRFPPDQFGFSFPFDPGSSLLTIFLGAASYD